MCDKRSEIETSVTYFLNTFSFIFVCCTALNLMLLGFAGDTICNSKILKHTPYLLAITLCTVASRAPNLTLPFISEAALCQCGARFLQCPHQGAKNSTIHMSSLSNTSFSKLLSVSSITSSALPPPDWSQTKSHCYVMFTTTTIIEWLISDLLTLWRIFGIDVNFVCYFCFYPSSIMIYIYVLSVLKMKGDNWYKSYFSSTTASAPGSTSALQSVLNKWFQFRQGSVHNRVSISSTYL